ncbi:MAG: ankyrin repeat domain-containing protein, partial [Thermodesulfobacteriota bacterium]
MEIRRSIVITKCWLASSLFLVLLPWGAIAGADAKLDEQLLEAAKSGDVVKAESALQKGANPNYRDNDGWTALTWASSRGHHDVVTSLVNKGADVNARGEYVDTPLIVAAGGGYIEIMELLLAKGADVNAIGELGQTPLVAAAESGHLGALQFLLTKPGDPGRWRGNKETAFRTAAGRGRLDVVRLLLANGVDINSSDFYGDRVTALMFAVKEGHL